MSLDTLAILVTDVMQGLGFPPDEYLPLPDAVRAVKNALAFYSVQLSQSNQNQTIKHKDFTPASRDKSLSDVEGVPAWMERLEGVSPDEEYIYIPATNLSALDESRARGEERCAFYTEDGILHVRFSYNPEDLTYQSHRLWYDPNPLLAETLADNIGLPINFSPMYSARARTKARADMMVNAANCENKPDEMLINAWVAAQVEDKEELREWMPQWKLYRLGSVGAARGRDRRPIIPRGYA